MAKPVKQHVPTAKDKEAMQQGAKASKAVDTYLRYLNDPERPKGRPINKLALEDKIDAESNLAK